MQLIKLKYRSLHNFSLQSNIPNSTLNSMFKKGLGGTSFDTVLKVCSLLDCDIYSLIGESKSISAEDRDFFSKYLSLDKSSKELVKMVTSHQLAAVKSAENEADKPAAKQIQFPIVGI